MSEPAESTLPWGAMRASFRAHYVRHTTFREDAALLDTLEAEAEPALQELFLAYAQRINPAPHEAYALLTLLARQAASLSATPSAALALVGALTEALAGAGVALDEGSRRELEIVVLEGYCAARDERVTAELRRVAADCQVSFLLAPRCLAFFLAGRHEADDLRPTLEAMGRRLLREDARSCLLDISGLGALDEELARAVGHFCAGAATLGVATFLVARGDGLRVQFESWGVGRGTTHFLEDTGRALALALAAAGLELRPLRPWAQLLRRRFTT